MDKTICELFAGVGGFHLGFHRIRRGWEVVWANQWEPVRKAQDAFACYVKNFPNVEALNIDIAEINNNPDIYTIPSHNLLVGGFPCQDYSVASTGARGIEGKKGVLWWEIEKILRRKNPPFVLLENVDRLLKSPASQRGRDFGIILGCFRDLGYSIEWRMINAADYGFAQKRKRVFIFAFHNSTNYYQEKIRQWNELGDNYIENAGFFSRQFPIQSVNGTKSVELSQDIISISNEFNFEFFEAGIMINNQILTQKYTAIGEAPITIGEILETNVDERYYLSEDLDKWEYMKGAKAEIRVKNGFEYVYREGALSFPDFLDKPARTMLTSEGTKNRSTHVIEDPQTGRLRILTPIECERINGFDDNWTNTGMSERFRYFCMGNALVVGLIERMSQELSEIFETEGIVDIDEAAITIE